MYICINTILRRNRNQIIKEVFMSYSREMNVDLGSVYLKSDRVAIFGFSEFKDFNFNQSKVLEKEKIQGLYYQDDYERETCPMGQVFKSDFDYNDGYGNRVKICGHFNDEYEITELIIRFYPTVTKTKKIGPLPIFSEFNEICIIDPAYTEILMHLEEDIQSLKNASPDYEPIVILGNPKKKQIVGLIISAWSCDNDFFYPIYGFKNEDDQIVELIIKIGESVQWSTFYADDLIKEGFEPKQTKLEYFKRNNKWQGNEEHLIDKYLSLPDFFDPDPLLKMSPGRPSYEGYAVDWIDMEWEKWERLTVLLNPDPSNPIIRPLKDDDEEDEDESGIGELFDSLESKEDKNMKKEDKKIPENEKEEVKNKKTTEKEKEASDSFGLEGLIKQSIDESTDALFKTIQKNKKDE